MKKILCLLMAVVSVGCMASCTLFKDHDDGVCDLCEKQKGVLFPVIQWEKNKELCLECFDKEYDEEEQEKLLKEKADQLGNISINDIIGGNKAN